MKNLGTVLAAIFVALVLALYMCSYQVRFTEVAVIKTWGKPADHAITQAGLQFKWPRPIQDVVIYDKRTRILEDRTEETRTVDGKNVLLTTYAFWRIADAAKFHTNFPGGVEDGETKLRTTIGAHKNAVVGKRRFSEFVSTDPKERKLHEIEQEIMTVVAKDAKREFGIEVLGFGIKKLGLPETTTTAIFRNMKANEEKKAVGYQAEGEARAADIRANADAIKNRIMAAAQEKVAEIERQAQQVVSDLYKEFDEHPELRIALDLMRTNKEALRRRTTLVIDDTKIPWSMFNEAARNRIPEMGRNLAEHISGDIAADKSTATTDKN